MGCTVHRELVGTVRASWCPRCGADLVAPSAMNSAWRCSEHGTVLPLTVFHRLDEAALNHVGTHAEVPLWMPDPLPQGWSMTGLATVGDERSRLRAVAASFTGPSPLGGDGEWLVVAEEPGIGLGGTYACSREVPASFTARPPDAKVQAHGHPTPLWLVTDAARDRSAYVGEANGVWLWIIGFPADAGYILMEELALTDARTQHPADLEPHATSERLRPAPHHV